MSELLVVGGINVKDQINQLNSGVDIVVGTPGRLEDLIQGGMKYVILIRTLFILYMKQISTILHADCVICVV